ncbi:T9SS type A sorting domain-containing protein [Chryseobacterium sp. BIGb0232]|uniref:T9SS type A sorting domain-containing protein n=1 Tax=Chryseobacterium sp. BIGb0232 TaxID=2940598 RepID=UPI000F46EC08|nr:T9SS type A sorting domain-containing protein [Chryseobacterium sp. BIGb0232]MCS4302186.1 hypothetical protein [Chryseobacterium sp. BIGb0232]ROS18131.1 putative secreted protein (Por secretion system target) [Chryseobacterium nakagawai]
MKKTCLFFFMIFLMSWSNLSAQRDYIIMVDNGGSINKQDYVLMRRGVIKLIEQLLACNPENRVAVVQYGTGILDNDTGIYKPLIYIESDFTNDFFTAQNFERRLDFGDYFQQSLGLIRNAMLGISNPDIVSPQKTLNIEKDPNFIVFTDAERASGGLSSYLVDPAYASNYGSYDAFADVMDFKKGLSVAFPMRFTVIHANINNDAIKAAASIADGDGPYSGPLEAVPGDPSNGHSRLYFNRDNGFHMVPSEINYWKNIAEKICHSGNIGALDFLYEPGHCIYQAGTIVGSYYLPSGATLQELKVDMINLETGEVYPVDSHPVFEAGNHFKFYLNLNSFDKAVIAGATGWYKLRLTMISNASTSPIYSWNRYPYFFYDVDMDLGMDCPGPMVAKSLSEEKLFKLTPNPTNGLFKVMIDKEVKSGTLEVRDLVGNTVYNKILRGEKEIEVDLSSRKEGVYIVNVTTGKNEIYSEKIIKK